MTTNKRYYWIKLPKGFFDQKEIKKMKKMERGDTYIIIYLQLLLESLEEGGKLYYEELEETFAEEIALQIDADAEDVAATLKYLLDRGILLKISEAEYELVTTAEMTGSESASAGRMRKTRRNKQAQSDGNASQCDSEVQNGGVEEDKEKEKIKRNEDTKQNGRQFSPNRAGAMHRGSIPRITTL